MHEALDAPIGADLRQHARERRVDILEGPARRLDVPAEQVDNHIAAVDRCLGGEAWGRLASVGVRCPTVGLEPPTTRSGRSAATGVRLSRPPGRAWGVGCVRAVFDNAPGPCKCFHGPFKPGCDYCGADYCQPSSKPCA